jgi:hypothetical protein
VVGDSGSFLGDEGDEEGEALVVEDEDEVVVVVVVVVAEDGLNTDGSPKEDRFSFSTSTFDDGFDDGFDEDFGLSSLVKDFPFFNNNNNNNNINRSCMNTKYMKHKNGW